MTMTRGLGGRQTPGTSVTLLVEISRMEGWNGSGYQHRGDTANRVSLPLGKSTGLTLKRVLRMKPRGTGRACNLQLDN